MKAEYDFSKARRAKDVPQLKKLQAAAGVGKTRISIMLDDAVIAGFRAHAEAASVGYQTEINRVLREYLAEGSAPVTLEALRQMIREELKTA